MLGLMLSRLVSTDEIVQSLHKKFLLMFGSRYACNGLNCVVGRRVVAETQHHKVCG
jgi:hypothetical protein